MNRFLQKLVLNEKGQFSLVLFGDLISVFQLTVIGQANACSRGPLLEFSSLLQLTLFHGDSSLENVFSSFHEFCVGRILSRNDMVRLEIDSGFVVPTSRTSEIVDEEPDRTSRC